MVFTFISTNAQEYGQFIDKRNNKTYKTIKIAGETWMHQYLAINTGNECYAYNYDNKSAKSKG